MLRFCFIIFCTTTTSRTFSETNLKEKSAVTVIQVDDQRDDSTEGPLNYELVFGGSSNALLLKRFNFKISLCVP
jgi:hypothetical protein